jgi:hypothetical protein
MWFNPKVPTLPPRHPAKSPASPTKGAATIRLAKPASASSGGHHTCASTRNCTISLLYTISRPFNCFTAVRDYDLIFAMIWLAAGRHGRGAAPQSPAAGRLLVKHQRQVTNRHGVGHRRRPALAPYRRHGAAGLPRQGAPRGQRMDAATPGSARAAMATTRSGRAVVQPSKLPPGRNDAHVGRAKRGDAGTGGSKEDGVDVPVWCVGRARLTAALQGRAERAAARLSRTEGPSLEQLQANTSSAKKASRSPSGANTRKLPASTRSAAPGSIAAIEPKVMWLAWTAACPLCVPVCMWGERLRGTHMSRCVTSAEQHRHPCGGAW